MQIERTLLPAALVAFFLLALVFPVLRHRWRTGTSGIAPLSSKDWRQRAIGIALAVILAGLALFAAAFASGGPVAVRAIEIPLALRLAGWGIVAAGFAAIVVAQAQMGRQWRIGIDAAPTDLVTGGLFSVVRHPIFAAMLLGLAGLVLVVPSPFALFLWSAAAVAILLEVRMEERHLRSLHGDRHRDYQRRVGRLVPRLRRKEWAGPTSCRSCSRPASTCRPGPAWSRRPAFPCRSCA